MSTLRHSYLAAAPDAMSLRDKTRRDARHVKAAYNIVRASRAKAVAVTSGQLSRLVVQAALMVALIPYAGCTQREDRIDTQRANEAPTVIVVAPVINLSDNADIDTLKVTDWVASELLEFPGFAVIPVNMTLAALVRQGKARVETPGDARWLANEFDADATLVAAITEYDPYDPQRVGLILQWYGQKRSVRSSPGLETGSRQAGSVTPASGGSEGDAPAYQVQRSFSAADERELELLRAYASSRGGENSPYGWRKYAKSQELFVRYCLWSMIGPMEDVRKADNSLATSDEAE